MKKIKLNRIYIWLCSFLFAIFCLVGYKTEEKIKQNILGEYRINVLLSLIAIILLTVMISIIIHLVAEIIKIYRDKKIKTNKINEFIKKRLGIVSLAFIILCWLVYIVAFYPTIITIDSYNQLKSFFGLRNYYSDAVVLISESMLITNFHPLIHTLLLRWIFKIRKIDFE